MRPSRTPRLWLPVLLIGAALVLAAPAGAQERGHEDDHHEHAGPARFVQPVGVVTLALLIATAVTGGLVRRKRRPLLTLHKLFGTLALLSAICHAVLVVVAE